MAVQSVVEVRKSILRVMMDHGSSLPEFAKQKMIEAATNPSPVDQMVQFSEAAYAHREKLPKAARDAIADIVDFAAVHDFHDLNKEGRANGMTAALRRSQASKQQGDPPAKPLFVEEEEPVDVPEVAPEPGAA